MINKTFNTKIFLIENIDDAQYKSIIDDAGSIIKAGGLVAFPTETVYGLGGDALNKNSSKAIYKAKGRPSDNPLIIHISNKESLYEICDNIGKMGEKLIEKFWPGPLTLIFKKKGIVPKETTGGLETVAVRMPESKLARDLIESSGGFIAAPSANRSGRPSSTLGDHVIEDFNGVIDGILICDEDSIGIESTVLDLTGEIPTILRPGFVSLEDIKEISPNVIMDKGLISSKDKPKAPGMKYRHYAPKGNLILVENIDKLISLYSREINDKGLIITEDLRDKIKNLDKYKIIEKYSTNEIEIYKYKNSYIFILKNELKIIARSLYKVLRLLDHFNIKNSYVTDLYNKNGKEEYRQALKNRLTKACNK